MMKRNSSPLAVSISSESYPLLVTNRTFVEVPNSPVTWPITVNSCVASGRSSKTVFVLTTRIWPALRTPWLVDLRSNTFPVDCWSKFQYPIRFASSSGLFILLFHEAWISVADKATSQIRTSSIWPSKKLSILPIHLIGRLIGVFPVSESAPLEVILCSWVPLTYRM